MMQKGIECKFVTLCKKRKLCRNCAENRYCAKKKKKKKGRNCTLKDKSQVFFIQVRLVHWMKITIGIVIFISSNKVRYNIITKLSH